jgi:serine protease
VLKLQHLRGHRKSLADDKGRKADFVADELLIATDDQDKLTAFLDRWNGHIVSSLDFTPLVERRMREGRDVSIVQRYPLKYYLVRIEAARASLASLPRAAQRTVGTIVPLSLRFSDQAGMATFAAAIHEVADFATPVALNYVLEPHSILGRSTMEAPSGEPLVEFRDFRNVVRYTPNAFEWPYMDTGSNQDIGVAEAWRALTVTGEINNTVDVTIFDGGFCAHPDLPRATSLITEGCAGNLAGPKWHGLQVALAGFGLPDNNMRGAAGPGGPVAELTLVSAPITGGLAIADILLGLGGALTGGSTIAGLLGADIVNISGATHVPFPVNALTLALEPITALLHNVGDIVLVASAGNEGDNVDDTFCLGLGIFGGCLGVRPESSTTIPCELAGVTCVGGLDVDSVLRDPRSNYGNENVDIFAPHQVWVGPNPDSPGGVFGDSAEVVQGTSFSAPFVAGVAALVKAANPGLSAPDVHDILIDTAHTHSPDSSVRRWVNAHQAVITASSTLRGNPPPFVIIQRPSEGATFAQGGVVPLEAEVEDDGPVEVTWTSSLDGPLLGPFNLSPGPFPGPQSLRSNRAGLSPGTHTITLTVTDGVSTVSDRVTIRITPTPPTVQIVHPNPAASPAERTFVRGEVIQLLGRSEDPSAQVSQPLPDANVQWWLDGVFIAFGHAADLNTAGLALGSHTLMFVGTTGQTAPVSTSVEIFIEESTGDLPPRVRILSPPPGFAGLPLGQDAEGSFLEVTFVGEAIDPEDGHRLEIGWYLTLETNGSGPMLVNIDSLVITLRLRLIGPCHPVYRVTLIAEDSAGNVRQASVAVSVICVD